MSMKQAADELLKIADEIEMEAAEVTQFVCGSCNHTATLATINGKRVDAAKAAGSNVVVSAVSVNDQVHCPACDGVMAYRETQASQNYYYDPDKVAVEKHDESKETPTDEAAETPAVQKQEGDKGTEIHTPAQGGSQNTVEASIDYDSLRRYRI
jgi:hypothetical protein